MKGMTPIVRNVAGLVSGFVMLYGLYVVCTGHLAPGGGFAGGVIMMAGAVMLMLAFGGDRARELMAQNRCHVLDGFGALAFALLRCSGFSSAGSSRTSCLRARCTSSSAAGRSWFPTSQSA